jgi:hypothetical protein
MITTAFMMLAVCMHTLHYSNVVLLLTLFYGVLQAKASDVGILHIARTPIATTKTSRRKSQQAHNSSLVLLPKRALAPYSAQTTLYLRSSLHTLLLPVTVDNK